MKQNTLETILGAIVIFGVVVFGYVISSHVQFKEPDGYVLQAKFNRVDGIRIGNSVKLGGIQIGKVSDFQIDAKTYMAVLSMQIDANILIPIDSSARIISEGLLGDTYVDIQPGGEDEMFQPNEVVQFTQDSINVVDLLGRFIFSLADSKEKK